MNALDERLERRLAALDRVFSILEKRVVLVEGKRDEAALRAIGASPARVLEANGKPEGVVARALQACGANQRIALLFDWDTEGVRKTRFFEERFRAEGAYGLLDRATPKRLKALLGYCFVEEALTKHSELLDGLKVKENG